MTGHEEEIGQLGRAARAARVGSFSWDPSTGEVTWSKELCDILGIAPHEFDGTYQGFLDLVHPEDVPKVEETLGRALEEGGRFRYHHRVIRPDGVVRVVHSQGQIEDEPEGEGVRMIGACWDVTEPEKARRQLQQSHSLLQAALDSTADGILVVDRMQRVVTYNRQFLRMWRIPGSLARQGEDAAMLGYVRNQLACPEDFWKKVHELYGTPEAESWDVLHFKDGRIFERVSRPQWLGGEVAGRVWSFRDVTAREEAIAARDLLLAVAAHELRGPVMSIRLAVQSLQQGLLPPARVPRILEIASRETTRLSNLVDQLLDVGRIRAEKLELEDEEVDLGGLVEDAVTTMGHEIDASGSEVRVELQSVPIIRADASRMAQVITNLLSNALKFGEGRPVDIRVERAGPDAVGQVRLTVRDRGGGMEPEKLEGIFEPFERRVSARHFGGLGLGLFIVRSLVEAMGGRVWVTSEPGRGSEFTVEIGRRQGEGGSQDDLDRG